jgi:hypothetical protein
MAPASGSITEKAANHDATYIACQTVFSTAELVEQILVHLPAKQLFSSQRVCKTFANAIATSPAIQVKMFKRLPDHPKKQTPESTEPSAKDKQPGTPSEAELAARHPVLSPWLVVIPSLRKCTKGMRPRKGVKVQFQFRRSKRQFFFTTKEDSYLDTYFCDPPCRTITVQQKYSVHGDSFENTQDVQIDRPMTVREVLEKALDQAGPITDSFSLNKEILNGTMRSMITSHEQKKDCTDGSKTVLSKVEFVLHGVLNPLLLEDETTELDEMMFNHLLTNRKVASSRARARMAE